MLNTPGGDRRREQGLRSESATRRGETLDLTIDQFDTLYRAATHLILVACLRDPAGIPGIFEVAKGSPLFSGKHNEGARSGLKWLEHALNTQSGPRAIEPAPLGQLSAERMKEVYFTLLSEVNTPNKPDATVAMNILSPLGTLATNVGGMADNFRSFYALQLNGVSGTPSLAGNLEAELPKWEGTLLAPFMTRGFPQVALNAYQALVDGIILQSWDTRLPRVGSEATVRLELVAQFLEQRERTDEIAPTLLAMAERASGSTRKCIVRNETFKGYLGEAAQVWEFRLRLQELHEDQDYSREQVACQLLNEGFDLKALDFNRWYAVETYAFYPREDDVKLAQYCAKHSSWLENLIARHEAGQIALGSQIDSVEAVDGDLEEVDEETDVETDGDHLDGIQALAEALASAQQEATPENPLPYWQSQLTPLLADHAQIRLDPAFPLQREVWDSLFQGRFDEMAFELCRATCMSRAHDQLNKTTWVLFQTEHTKHMHPVLLQDAFAMIICGEIAVGKAKEATKWMQAEELQSFHHADKIRAAVNLGWETLQSPTESDDPKEWELPRGYLLGVAKRFESYLDGNPSAAPYLQLVKGTTTALDPEHEKILSDTADLSYVCAAFKRAGRESELTANLNSRFQLTCDTCLGKGALWADIGAITGLLSDPNFKAIVSPEQYGATLRKSIESALQKEDPKDAALIAAKLYLHPDLHPLLGGQINIEDVLRKMMSTRLKDEDLLHKPFSLLGQHEIAFMDRSLEIYVIADKLRAHIRPSWMQSLVATVLTRGTELNSPLVMSAMSLEKEWKNDYPNYSRPDYFPEWKKGMTLSDPMGYQASCQLLGAIYEREKRLGGLDSTKASTGITNVLFRAIYVQPGRYPLMIDAMMAFLDSPVAELVPENGLGGVALRDFRVLHNFLKQGSRTPKMH